MKVSCGVCQNRFTAPARPWCASGGGHMSWRTFVVGVDASAEAAAAAGFACRTAERADAGCRLVHATRDVLAAFEAPQAGAYRHAIVEQARGQIAAVLSGKVSAGTRDEMIVRFGSPAGVLKDVVAEIGRSEEHTSELQSPCKLVC